MRGTENQENRYVGRNERVYVKRRLVLGRGTLSSKGFSAEGRD